MWEVAEIMNSECWGAKRMIAGRPWRSPGQEITTIRAMKGALIYRLASPWEWPNFDTPLAAVRTDLSRRIREMDGSKNDG